MSGGWSRFPGGLHSLVIGHKFPAILHDDPTRFETLSSARSSIAAVLDQLVLSCQSGWMSLDSVHCPFAETRPVRLRGNEYH